MLVKILQQFLDTRILTKHVDDDDKLNDKTASSLGQRGGWFINESGLYSLILSSKLPNAKRFKHWVTAEVLPAIRKTGSYSTPAAAEMPNRKLTVDDYIRIASFISTCKNERLPYVLAFLRSGGIELPETPQAAHHSARVERDTTGEAQKSIGTARLVYGVTYTAISEKTAINRHQLRRIYLGESVPTLQRTKTICDAIRELISKTE